MFTRATKLLAALAALAPAASFGAPITIDFTVTSTSAFDGFSAFDVNAPSYNGFASIGTVGSGWVTFDDAVGNYSSFDVGLPLIDFQFDWAGATFTEANTQLWSVGFGAGNSLNYFQVGALPCLNCLSSPGPTDFFLTGTVFGGDSNISTLHVENVPGWITGSVSWSQRQSATVPEPATLGLFALGMLGAAAARRRRTN